MKSKGNTLLSCEIRNQSMSVAEAIPLNPSMMSIPNHRRILEVLVVMVMMRGNKNCTTDIIEMWEICASDFACSDEQYTYSGDNLSCIIGVMSSFISTYITSIQQEFDTGQSTEHSFRSALKTLLESLNSNILALNESQRITGVGMPDFTIKDIKNTTINIGWIEAKDLRVNLDEKRNSDQLGRYLGAFDNFVYTNNLVFKFYRGGKLVETVSL